VDLELSLLSIRRCAPVIDGAWAARVDFGPGPATTTLTLATDNLYFKGVADSGAVERLLDQPTQDVRQMVSGYAVGYNHYVAEQHPAPLKPCAG
jgi:hypothetical protein